MKISFTPPLYLKQAVTGFNCLVAMFFITATYKSQTATTFTATDITVTNTLTSAGRFNADGISATDTIKAADDVMIQQNLHVAGNILLTGNLTTPLTSTATLGALTTNGAAIFNNALKISNFTGTGSGKVYVDANGFLQRGDPLLPAGLWECVPSSPNWNIGGNNALGFVTGPNPLTTFADVGTCDGVDFVLKANNIQRQWIKPDGKIGFGIQNPGSLAGPEYQFHGGALRLSGANSFGGPQLIFDGGSPNGDWGIEYINASSAPLPGLNFWKPAGSSNSFNYLFFIGDDGRVTVGDVNEAASARFNVDGWNGNGIRAKVNANAKAYSVFNKNTLAENFIVYGDGNTRIGAELPTTTPYMLTVNGRIGAREIKVSMQNPWPDYVFQKGYKLRSLENLESYLAKNKHLPNIPSAAELNKEICGLDLAQMQGKQMEKIEEIYLHLIELNKQVKELQKENADLKKQIKK